MMLQNRQPIVYGDGQQKRCFSFIDDCTFCHSEMATNQAAVGEVINIGPDEEFITILSLAEVIANFLAFNLDPQFVAERPQEVKLATCSSDKACRLLKYKTTVDLRDGLQHMIDSIRLKDPKSFKYHLDLEIVMNEPRKPG